MLKELYTAAMGMMPQQTRLEVIANNMANASTVGFKRSGVFERNLIDARGHFYNVPGDIEQNDPPIGSYIDYTSGSYEQTGNPLDLALENPKAFFMVTDGDGNLFLTKAGRFKLDSDGYIITTDGKRLNSATGPIVIQRIGDSESKDFNYEKTKNITITDKGEIFLNNTPVGNISIVEVSDLSSIEHISNANFIIRPDTDVRALSLDEIKLRQGWLENSNVNIISEMIQMIELQRQYEVGSKVIHTNDSTLDNSMKIGKYY